MPDPTHVDAAEVQLLLADLQVEIVARSKTTDPRSLAASAGVWAQLAGAFGLPITVSTVPDADKAPQLIPELAHLSESQHIRASASPFLDEPTRTTMAAHGRRTLVIAGCMTEVVVLHAAANARREGYRVLIPVDACGGLSDRTERAALRQIESVGGEVSSTVTLATAMAPDFTTDLGKRMFGIIQKIRLA